VAVRQDADGVTAVLKPRAKGGGSGGGGSSGGGESFDVRCSHLVGRGGYCAPYHWHTL